jgi:hypothetical protein
VKGKKGKVKGGQVRKKETKSQNRNKT